MKKIFPIFAIFAMLVLAVVLTGCSWIGPGNQEPGYAASMSGTVGRGTTGVSSGADNGSTISGSDSARR